MYWRNDIDPEGGHHKVMITRGKFIDAARDNREVPYKIYYPVNHDMTDLPVIIWSHGLGGGADGAAFLARYIASYGYVMVHIQHRGTDTTLWEGKAGHPWDVIRETKIPRSASLDRFRDVPFVMDELPQWAKDNPEISQHMDLSNIGMSGHSFGALTTQVAAGQMFPDEDEKLIRMPDDRFKAGILYSPVPISYLTDADSETLYGSIDIPLLHMTGTDDSSPVEDFDYTHRMKIYEHAVKTEQALLILQDGDHMVYNGSRGKLADNPKRGIHEDIIKIASLAYWDAYLKDDQAAREWLLDGGFEKWLGDDGSFKHKRP